MTFDEWYAKNKDIRSKHMHLNHPGDRYVLNEQAMHKEVWDAAQRPLLERINDLEQVITELQERDI